MESALKEKVVVVGFGWVGQANALALSNFGYDVYYYDVQKPELRYADTHEEHYDRITPLSDVTEMDSSDTWYMVCVGDKVSFEGEQDISAIKKALESLKNVKGGIILRSTILPGHLEKLNFHYYVPEFLHERKAVEECMSPQYFILGHRGDISREPSFFTQWKTNASKIYIGTPEEASYIKYLSNIWNALRISFVNEFGNVISYPEDKEKLADIEKIIDFFFERKAYMRYGRSYSGHCLPKDTHAFLTWYKKRGKNVPLIEGAHLSNNYHKTIETKYPYLPEWFSEWVRPEPSGRAALKALKSSVLRRIKNVFNALQPKNHQ